MFNLSSFVKRSSMNVKSKFYVVFLTYTIIINQLVGGLS